MLHRPLLSIILATAIALTGATAQAAIDSGTDTIGFQKSTPILLADDVEACLAFLASFGVQIPVTGQRLRPCAVALKLPC